MCVREKLRRVRKEEEVAKHAREAEVGQIDVCYTMSALLASEAVTVICCTVFELRANCCALVPSACLL